MSTATALTSPFLAPEVSTDGAAVGAAAILGRAEATLLSRFADQIVSLVASSAGDAEPPIERERPPIQDPVMLLVTRAPIPDDELEAARWEICGPPSSGRGVVLLQILRRNLSRLPADPRLIDLAAGCRTVAGEPTRLPEPPSPEEIPLIQGEELLRRGLVDLIAGFPEGDDAAATLRSTSRAALAAVDALLILKKRYATRLEEKRGHVAQLGGADGLLGLLDAAVSARAAGETPPGWSAGRFWGATLHFFLDVLLALLVPVGPQRAERLEILLAGYAVRSISPRETVRRLARTVFFANRKGERERLLLALAIVRDWDAPKPTIAPLARRAGIPEPQSLSWSDLRERTLAAWRGGMISAR